MKPEVVCRLVFGGYGSGAVTEVEGIGLLYTWCANTKVSEPFRTADYINAANFEYIQPLDSRNQINMPKPIQLYTRATPNGRKISIALEEMQLSYEAHCVDIGGGEQFSDEYVKNVNPNSKIPAIIDPDGPGGQEHRVFESGAILMYLAEKSGELLSSDPAKRSETIQWLFFQNAGVGPMFGQFGHFFKFGKDNCDHPYPLERYTNEAKRLLAVLDKQLEGQDYLVGEYSIADISTFPWIGCLDWGYEATDHLGLSEYKNVMAWHERCETRPATQKGSAVCGF